jgi:hypothetical protein
MGTHMKTTVEIAPALLGEAKKIAAHEGTTVRNLIEQGLRRVIAERSQRSRFELRKATFNGEGLSEEARAAGWDAVRASAYGERGG